VPASAGDHSAAGQSQLLNSDWNPGDFQRSRTFDPQLSFSLH
jgi:hypothetical protein